MESQNKHGKTIEPKLKKIDANLKGLNVHEELYRIIHFPGYTSIAHLEFINGTINSINTLTDLLEKQLNTLHQGSKLIVNEK